MTTFEHALVGVNGVCPAGVGDRLDRSSLRSDDPCGMTVILVAGLFTMLRWPTRHQLIAGLTLAAVATYIVLREGDCLDPLFVFEHLPLL